MTEDCITPLRRGDDASGRTAMVDEGPAFENLHKSCRYARRAKTDDWLRPFNPRTVSTSAPLWCLLGSAADF